MNTGFYLSVFISLLVRTIVAQDLKPAARFSFNNSSNIDEISKKRATLAGAKFIPDRFNNEASAVYLNGNEYSYINLGNSPALKPKVGSISIWLRLENEIWAGKGYFVNPIILTKRWGEDDFYEAYAIYYFLEGNNIGVCNTLDSMKQVGVSSSKAFQRYEWQHLVFTYNYDSMSLYINGRLENRIAKQFETQFLEGDSVMVGVSANKKNNRWLNAAVDDIEFYDRVLTAGEVWLLYTAPNPNRFKIFLYNALKIVVVVVLLCVFYFLIRFRVTRRLKKEKDQLLFTNQLLEMELRVNRALMNPHFVFNSLNTLQHFVLNGDTQSANNYLVKFSQLIRRILESNLTNTISLETEIELIERYLALEDLRFEKRIAYSITVDPAIIPSAIQIPVMMVQPFIENAIWHGLLRKQGEKLLTIRFSLSEDKYLLCVIDDNGIGRQNTGDKNQEKNSLATAFVMQRLEILNKLYGLHCSLLIEDKTNGGGTTISILLPILNK